MRWACTSGHVPLAGSEGGKVIPVLFSFIKALGFTANQRTFSENIISRATKLPQL